MLCSPRLERAADVLVQSHFCVSSADAVVITADPLTDWALVDAVARGTARAGAQVVLMVLAQLPFQGALADPFIPAPVRQGLPWADVWFDMTFPYLAGSAVHDEVMKARRTRYLLMADLRVDGFTRLYGSVDFDMLFDVQDALDRVVADAEGKECCIKCPLGSDVRFVMGRPATRKSRRATHAGTQTIPGSAIMFPVPETVSGRIVVETAFHEYYAEFARPVTLEVDNEIKSIDGSPRDIEVMARALRRASRRGYGHVIHFTYGFSPAARFTGQSFYEDIRVEGNNAVGLGLPWWEPGGGENHPDAVMTAMSLWLDGTHIIDQGKVIAPPALVELKSALAASFSTGAAL